MCHGVLTPAVTVCDNRCMSETYYHVAPTTYQAGDDLLCWNMLEARGIVTEADWKWDEVVA